MKLLVRSLIICLSCLAVQISTSRLTKALISKELLYPAIIAFTPFLASFIPLLGMSDLVKSGMQPLIATLLLFGISFGVQFGLEQIKNSKQTDSLSLFIKQGTINLEYVDVDRQYITILIITLLLELLIQYAYGNYIATKQIDMIVKGMEKFYKKHNIKLS
jgi:hypothetical protein